MKFKEIPDIDLRLIIFIILLMLLPFILLSNGNAASERNEFPMPIDTIGTEVSGIVLNYENDTLLEHFPAIFSPLYLNLVSIPADTVYITMTPDAQLDLGDGPGVAVQLLFPPYPVAMTPQEIKVKPVNDAVYEGYHYGNIAFSLLSDDAGYAAYTISDLMYLIEDDDLPPGISTDWDLDTTLTEGIAGVTWLFALNSIPADTVYITADPDEDIRITGIPDEAVTLVFPPNASALNWQDMQVRAYDDEIYEGDHTGFINLTVSSDDPVYASLILDDVIYPIIDNDDPPGINFTYDVDTFLTEGLTGIPLMFSLGSIPADTVKIIIDPDAQMRITGIPDEAVTLVFEPDASALSPQSVNIRAYDDLIYEGDHSGTVQFFIVTVDTVYDDFILPDVVFDIVDNDLPPGLNYSFPADITLEESGGEYDLTISLYSIPDDTVKITITPDDQLRIAAGPGEPYDMIFLPNSSALNEHVASIKAYQDYLYEGPHEGILTFDIISNDLVYDAFTIDTLTISIVDDDLMPAIIFNDTSNLEQVEGDTTLFFTVVLGSIPEIPVTIQLDPDQQLDLGKGRGSAINLKFKEDSALIEQNVMVIPYDDDFIEGLHIGKIGVNVLTDDINYAPFVVDSIAVSIIDNDEVGIAQLNPAEFSVYPAISNGEYQISSVITLEKIAVFNIGGALVYLSDDIVQHRLDLTSLSDGVYTVVAFSSTGTWYFQVEIIR